MRVREFSPSDTPILIELFRDTVHTVGSKDYSQQQLKVWAPTSINQRNWEKRFEESFTIVAEISDQIVGFANLESNGCVDMIYVASFAQRKGIGTALFKSLEEKGRSLGLTRLYSDVSLTARKFFTSKGFKIEREYLKLVDSVSFPNAIMFKKL